MRFARSGGLSEREIFQKHILKNAMIPIVHGIPGSFLGALVGAILGAKIYGGFDLLEADAAEAVSHSNVPILVIHGESDTFVPPVMSELTHSTDPGLVQRVTFPGADHALSFLSDTPRYKRIVREFIRNVL